MNASGTGEGARRSSEAHGDVGEPAVNLSTPAAVRSVLRIRPFRRLWGVLSVVALADWLGLLATAIFATQLVEGPLAKGAAFGGVVGIRLLPALVLGPIAGVIADRFDRRYNMVVCDLLRFALFASIPLALVIGVPELAVLGWAGVAIFMIETITLVWTPAKDAALPNLVPRAKLETAQQLSLIATYGVTPVAAALMLAGLDAGLRSGAVGAEPPILLQAAPLALLINAASRLATAFVVFYGIKEISGRDGGERAEQPTLLRQFWEGWKYIGQTQMVRGLVLGILGAFSAGGIVIGTAQFYAQSLGGGNATFYLLFGIIFLGLGSGIAFGPWLIGELSRRRWFGMSIILAAAGVIVLALAVHLTIAAVGALLVGAGAGMAFLSGITLLGGEVGDQVRGRVFAFVHTGVRVVLMLAIALSSVLVGAGGSRLLDLGLAEVPVSYTRVLLFAAGVFGILAGRLAFRQMDDKLGVPVLADLWSSVRGRPLSVPEPAWAGLFVVFEGGEGAGKTTQVSGLAQALSARGHQVVVTREPGATEFGARIRGMLLAGAAGPAAPSPRAEALLYAADRAHHVATVVRPALARGCVVISDRYVDSSLAYQGSGRSLPVDEVAWLSSWAARGLKPDLVVLLDVAPEVGLARVDGRGAGADRLEQESVAFHERVRHAFLDIAAADHSRYLVLDASLPPDAIAAAVLERVTPMLPPVGVSDADLHSIVDRQLERRP